MTETDAMVTGQASTSPHLTEAAARRRAARQRGELIFRSLGLAALGLAALFLVALMYSVFKKSYNGFVQSFITLEIPLDCLLYTSPSPRDVEESRMPSSA